MKKIFPCLALLLSSFPAWGAEPAASSATPASAPAVSVAKPAEAPIPGIDPAATAIWSEHARGMGDRRSGRSSVNFDLVTSKAFEFFQKYPKERRVGGILYNLVSFGDWLAEDPRSADLAPKWREHLRIALDEAFKQPWPDNVWSGLNWVGIRNDIALQHDRGETDLKALRARLDAVAARTPESPYRIFMQKDYLEQLTLHDPAAQQPFLTELTKSPVPEVAAFGLGELAILDLKKTPMVLKFTAVDGREVDLAKLRGKVVLIDCWATWCMPCIKELPNVKAALAKWGDKGFTVIGMSFDKPKDREKLIKLIAKENLTWPNWITDEPGPNSFGKKYNIRSIPATFLLGKDGLLVTTETRGPKLEAALTKLLGP